MKFYEISCIYIYIYVCSPVEGPRRTETSHFFIKSLELKCQVHFFPTIYIYMYAGCFMYMYMCMYMYMYMYMCVYFLKIIILCRF